MVHNTAPEAGTAAPTPAAVALPSYSVDQEPYRLRVQARDWSRDPEHHRNGQRVVLSAGEGSCTYWTSLTPAQARELAVYLVDCANALDNPAARVIADTTEDVANVYPWHPANFEGEGIGHE